ncbi:OLC1v1033288C1 [Oldenlandia corymbosa var. corymbosa]|uniref:OLC1v1033288C1 n=1 Tax=Oldenlandia corymbosa var. corymbosa TaxID=529605 RepID=A0AAV1CNP7_OLDCO|nr:OLC1v1033288C1 [Oldenlandia corymbosa var. corymbosa]
MAAPGPPPVGVPQGGQLNGPSFSFAGNSQLGPMNQPLPSNNIVDAIQDREAFSTPQAPHTTPQPGQTNSTSRPGNSATVNMPLAPSYQVLSGFPNTPITHGMPGISPSTANMTATPPGEFSAAFPRPTMQAPHLQHPAYASYPSVPPVSSSLQGAWLQPTQVSGLLRPPFSPYPAAFTSPFPLPARSTPIPSVPSPDLQPPGVTNVGASSGTPIAFDGSARQLTTSPMQQETPPGVDNAKDADIINAKDGLAVSEQLAWSAHRTEAGTVYYYNSVTGQSTYDKPSGFVGEPEKVIAHPTPVSLENLDGSDWVLVTTNDGKRYYYNKKTKLSSWQIPSDVTEAVKKEDANLFKTQPMSVSTTNVITEKGSTPVTLSIPAANTGGRDATVLRSSSTGSSSALDLIKKKLQDPGAPLPVAMASDPNGSKLAEGTVRDSETENTKEKIKDSNGESNISDSSSESDDEDNGPSKEACIIQFKEMLKERGVAPFSKWEKELPKIVFDPRFQAISSQSARKALFEHYVRNRAEEERKERRAAQKAAVEGFKKLLDEAKEQIDRQTDYHKFKDKWGHDARFLALDRKDREALLNERILPLKRAAEERARAVRAAAISSFKSMLQEKGDITSTSHWSKVKDGLRNDPRYKSIQHEEREALFNEYISELRTAEKEKERLVRDKNHEEDKLKERERELRKRKEREEQEVERVRAKVRRKVAVESYQALLVEIIKDPQASWTESKPRLEKDPQGRAANPLLDLSEMEKLFREHVKILQERAISDFQALLTEKITEAAAREKDGKTVVSSWSTAKQLLKPDPRYAKVARKDRETLWKRHVEEIHRRQKAATNDESEEHKEGRKKTNIGADKNFLGSRTHDRRDR